MNPIKTEIMATSHYNKYFFQGGGGGPGNYGCFSLVSTTNGFLGGWGKSFHGAPYSERPTRIHAS